MYDLPTLHFDALAGIELMILDQQSHKTCDPLW